MRWSASKEGYEQEAWDRQWKLLVGKKLMAQKLLTMPWESFFEMAKKVGMHSKASNQEASLRNTYELLLLPGLRDIVTGELIAAWGTPLTEADVKKIQDMGFTTLEVED